MNLKISLRITHPNIDPIDVINTIGLKPTRSWKVGDPRVTPNGLVLSGTQENSYCAFFLMDSTEYLEECIMEHIRSVGHLQGFFHMIANSGGQSAYYVTASGESHCGFVFDADFLSELSSMKIGLLLDVYSGGHLGLE